MTSLIVSKSGPLRGVIAVPGDKSITHRALILGALAEGDTRVRGWVPAEVCLATLRCMRALGVEVEDVSESSDLLIHGVGLRGLAEPADVLHCAGSGTTIRLLAGLLAGQPFTSVLTGTDPLRRRPMGRVAEPLRQMGATILGRDGGRLAPLTIRGGNLRGIDYAMPVASAQVKSAILLAGLFAEGETVVHEPGPSRDHTERMLAGFEVEVKVEAEGRGAAVRLQGGQRLIGGGELTIAGDFSSAAFLLVAAAIVPGSDVRLTGVGVNPTRTGLYDLLVAMAADLRLEDTETRRHGDALPASPHPRVPASGQGEPLADLVVHASPLRATEAHGDLIVRAIDEFPIFAVAATQAAGTTVIREAAELRVKESDRIASVATELRKMGAQVEERPDGMLIHGPTRLRGAVVECHRDHRLAMALAVAGLIADGPTEVRGAEAIGDSFPNFVEAMQALGATIAWSGESGVSDESTTQYAPRTTLHAPRITGTTRLVGVIGWPVGHSRSPQMHNAAYAALGLDWAYVPLPVAPERVGDAVRGLVALGFAGANVTVPHKQAVIPYLDELTPVARAIGAVNTIVVQPDGSLLGDSTDGAGFMADLRAQGVLVGGGQRIETDKRIVSRLPPVAASPHPRVPTSPCHRVLVLGAGGAARAVVYALVETGATVAVANRTLATAQELCQTIGAALIFTAETQRAQRDSSVLSDLSVSAVNSSFARGAAGRLSAYPFPDALAGLAEEADLVVNTTSLGLHAGDPLPWDASVAFRPGQVVYDLIYNRPTELMALALSQGATALDGLGMLVHQGARSAALWTGKDADELAHLMREGLRTP